MYKMQFSIDLLTIYRFTCYMILFKDAKKEENRIRFQFKTRSIDCFFRLVYYFPRRFPMWYSYSVTNAFLFAAEILFSIFLDFTRFCIVSRF